MNQFIIYFEGIKYLELLFYYMTQSATVEYHAHQFSVFVFIIMIFLFFIFSFLYMGDLFLKLYAYPLFDFGMRFIKGGDIFSATIGGGIVGGIVGMLGMLFSLIPTILLMLLLKIVQVTRFHFED